MRVGIDVSPLLQTRAGTARYLEGLLPHLERRVDVHRFSYGGAGKLTTLARDAWWYPVMLPRRAREVDVLHCPTFRGPVRSRTPLVVTVHDLAVLRHPEVFNRWTRNYSRVLAPRVVRAAQRVIAISEFTKRELIDILGVADERITVVPNAVGEPFVSEGPRADGDYMLAVGTLEPRKNLPRLAAAARQAGLELRIVGARGWGDVNVAGDGVRFLGFVSDDELAELYRGALCVAYVSFYEGFGIPVLEALACGAPVVTSKGTPMEEIAGGAAVLVDPYDTDAVAAGAEAIGRREELAALGPERARRYTWDATARATADVYNSRMSAPLVVLDADVLGRQRTGDETYVQNLLRRLPEAANGSLRFVAVTRHPELVPDGVEPIRLDAESQIVRMSVTLPRLLARLRPALAHFQHSLPLRSSSPAVVTVHDLSFEREPKAMGRIDRFIFRRRVPRSARQASRVFAVSERTRRDLMELYGIPSEKIVVTPNAVDPVFSPGGAADGYLLFVGAIQERKNPLAAVDAANAIGMPLVVVGPEKEPELARELERRGAALRGYVDKTQLADLYSGAACVLLPSRYEGFGLPVLEAMACGTPVVATNDEAMREVGGDAAVYAEPGDFPDAIRRVLVERDERSRAGLERARLFSWDESARRAVAAYLEVLGL